MSFTEFLWKLLATAMVIGIIGIMVATRAEHGSTLQGYAHLVVGTCTLVTILAVILQIWQYKPRSRRRCGNMPQ
jgi:uncharacterized membrane protein YsdA (DUF1294 family)